MRVLKIALLVSTAVGIVGCEQQSRAADLRLENDLAFLDSLALGVATPVAEQNIVSPIERNEAEEIVEEEAPVKAKAAPKKVAASSSARKSSSSRSSSSARSRSSSGSGGYSGGTVARQPRVTTVKHTKRDAAIGAGAGAVIGAVVGGKENRVKGAVIGGATGAALGAIVGSTIDKSTRVDY